MTEIPREVAVTCRLLGIDCAIVNGGIAIGYHASDPRARDAGFL